ncbi:MAG: ABC transporter permease [Candidatus Heimdallarchaeota archaeon]
MSESAVQEFQEWREAWRRFKRNRAAVVALGLFLVIVFLAIFADWIAPFDPLKTKVAPSRLPPSRDHLFGTDQVGRDIFSGVIHGTRTGLLVGIISTLISVTIAIIIGILAGYLGGTVDMVIMRIVEILLSIPPFIFAMTIVILYGVRLPIIILVIGLLSWPTLARIVRAEVLSLKEREFVMAIRSVGASDFNIVFDEVLPNALPPLIPAATLQVATAILFEAALSFLGFGDPNVASWGKSLWIAQQALYAGKWWPVIFPGVFIVLTALSFSVVGDGLNDALNPKLR